MTEEMIKGLQIRAQDEGGEGKEAPAGGAEGGQEAAPAEGETAAPAEGGEGETPAA